jgi:hypothetical protein
VRKEESTCFCVEGSSFALRLSARRGHNLWNTEYALRAQWRASGCPSQRLYNSQQKAKWPKRVNLLLLRKEGPVKYATTTKKFTVDWLRFRLQGDRIRDCLSELTVRLEEVWQKLSNPNKDIPNILWIKEMQNQKHFAVIFLLVLVEKISEGDVLHSK